MATVSDENFGGEDQLLDFYQNLRAKIRAQLERRKESGRDLDKASDTLVQLLFLLPDLFHLAVRMLFDSKVPARSKGALVASVAYVVSPIDLIPDTIPVAGWVDDLVVLAMGLNAFLDTDEQDIKLAVDRHWAGDEEVFVVVAHILKVADEAATFLPKKIMSIIKAMFPRRPK